VNSGADEWAPALSPDGTVLLFASNGRGGKGRHDLFIARAKGAGWAAATPLPGEVNTALDEFDATFLADGTSIVFARSPDVQSSRITLQFARTGKSGEYGFALPLALSGKLLDVDALGPAMSWRDPSVLFFSAAATGSTTMRPDIYEVRYRLR
jgi:hypothetical protein